MGIIVTTRTNPDLDGVACAVAYVELLQAQSIQATAWLPGTPDSEATFALGYCSAFADDHPTGFDSGAQLVYVDASGIEGFPVGADPNAVIEVIDHRFHGNPHATFPNASIFLEEVGAAATIIVERFRNAGRFPSTTSGTLLYGAIHSNTQNLIGSITNIRDRIASQWLTSNSAISSTYLTSQFEHKTKFITSNLPFCLLRENKAFRDDIGDYNISQLEFVGATSLDSAQRNLIEVGLAEIGRRSMVNMVDIVEGVSRLVVPDAVFRAHIAQALQIAPTANDFEFEPAILRKQIVKSLETYTATR